MAKFRTPDLRQRVMIPISLSDQIAPSTLEYAIHELVENRLDFSPLNARFKNDEEGRPAIDPKILLKVALLAYSRGIVGSRRIEKACRENIIFLALTGDDPPDHSSIATFVSSLGDQVREFFCQVLLVCEEMKLLGGTYFAVDGCKLPSNASKTSSGTLAELQAKKDSLERKLARIIAEHRAEDRRTSRKSEGGDDSPQEFPKRQIEKLKHEADRIEKFLAGAKPRMGTQGKEVKSNITDPDSAKMSTSHGTIQGYNAQAIVDDKHQIIVAGLASGEGQDARQMKDLLPILKGNLENVGYREMDFPKATLAGDSGYFSISNLKASETMGFDTLIPDNNFRKRDPLLVDQKRHQPLGHGKFPISQFQYDSRKDTYTCPAGQEMHSYARQTKFNGRRCRLYVGRKEICQACGRKKECLKKNSGRRTLTIPLGGDDLSITDRMKEKIDSPEGRKRYGKRMGTVEPVFGNLRENKGLKRITLRGKIKATTQWLLWCMVQNIEKIKNFGLPG